MKMNKMLRHENGQVIWFVDGRMYQLNDDRWICPLWSELIGIGEGVELPEEDVLAIHYAFRQLKKMDDIAFEIYKKEGIWDNNG